MPISFRVATVVLSLAFAYSNASAQLQDRLSENAQISLITVLPGDDIYSLWGHSAIRVYDPASGIDVSYNWGTFDFDDDWFVLKFMYGNLMYRLSRHNFDLALEHYREVERRSVIEQVLNLTPAHRDSVIQFLSFNYLPENRYYAYHFLFDNCSTRVRDAFERALGSTLIFSDEPELDATFRQLLDPYQSDWPFLDSGIDWLLGAPVDRVARPYETMFLPVYLMDAFDHATVEVDGAPRPLVVSTDTLVWIGDESLRRAGFPWEAGAAWALFLLGAVLTIRAARQGRHVLRLFDGMLFLVVGVAGILIAFLWFVSLHDVTENNWHLLWTWPTHVVAGIALFRRRSVVAPWLASYVFAAGTLALVALLGAPLWPQAFHPVHYPIMLLVVLRGAWIFLGPKRSIMPAAVGRV